MKHPARPSSPEPLVRVFVVGSVLAVVVTLLAVVEVLVWSRPEKVAAPPPAPTVGRSAVETRALELTAAPSAVSTRTPPPTPRWVWSSDAAAPNDRIWLRTRVDDDDAAGRVTLHVTADNHAIVRVGGDEIARGDDWQRPFTVDLTASLAGGEREIVVEAWNDGGPAGVVALLEVTRADGTTRWTPTGVAWEVAGDATFAGARAATDLGPLGTDPWGAVPLVRGLTTDRAIRVLEGFDVELVYSVPAGQGSWVCLTVDAEGRLLAGAQGGGLYRVTPSAPGEPASDTVVEPIDLPVRDAQGLLEVDGALFVMTNRPNERELDAPATEDDPPDGPGLFRLRDTDGDDTYDTVDLVRAIPGRGGEHGRHAIALGPDGLLYVVAGNHVPLPELEQSAVPRVWDEDNLLPRLWDAGGHAVGIHAPGGWICRTDPAGGPWELVSIGFRNAYDMAFDEDGELFTYDADMEWDMGAPWYRPTRVNHVTSGSEFGWRSGSAKWPEHYPDSLPAVVDVGPGSPTGVLFGTGADFPDRYRRALFLLDWTFGTMYATHLEPDGASFTGTLEMFLTGRPLPLTDAVVNPVDGTMYFAVGGRGADSAVYRVRWTGDAGPPTRRAAASEARTRRHALEAGHRPDPPSNLLDDAWAALDDPDRHVRFAARTVLEHAPVDAWAGRAIDERRPRARTESLLALARVGGAERHDELIAALEAVPWETLDDDGRAALLRVWSLAFQRTGAPTDDARRRIRSRFEAIYPTANDTLDRELCDLLVFLESPRVVALTIPLMERVDDAAPPPIDPELLARRDAYGQVILRMASAPPQRQQVHYALALRTAERGWTPDLRERYFRWFESARHAHGGRSFAGFLKAIRDEALARVPETERARYAAIGVEPPAGIDLEMLPRGPGRAWTVDEVVTRLDAGLAHRGYERGRTLYVGAQCASCHRFAGVGRLGGPDLTGVATRFTTRDLVRTVIEPSATVSDQYRQEEFVLDDDSVVVGRVVSEDDEAVHVVTSLLAPDATTAIPRARIGARRPSAVSPMMPRLLDTMAPGEVLDLLAYVLSGGDPRDPVFVPPGAGDERVLFDGVSLDGWEGDRTRWSVEDGAIVGRVTETKPLGRNTFLVLDEPLPADFVLRVEVKVDGPNNSGVQYRSAVDDTGRVTGPQCDVHPEVSYDGMLYEEGGRGIVARHGERVRTTSGGTTPIAPAVEPIPFRHGMWHEYTVIAQGTRLEHRIDGTVTCVVDDPIGAETGPRGDRLALQLHAGAPYEVRFRRIVLRPLDGAASAAR
jgi:putative heme-binding domain-containing protein